MVHTDAQIRANFTESIEDAEEVLRTSDQLDTRFMAYGAGLLMIRKCREWNLLRENELDIIENRLHRLMNGDDVSETKINLACGLTYGEN